MPAPPPGASSTLPSPFTNFWGSPPMAVVVPPLMLMLLPLPPVPPPMPAAFSPPVAVTVPPEMVMLLPLPSTPPPMPAPANISTASPCSIFRALPPAAVTSPPLMVMLLAEPLAPPPIPAPPSPPLAFRLPSSFSSVMVSLPLPLPGTVSVGATVFFSTPACFSPLLTVLFPSSSMTTSPLPVTSTAA